VPAAVPAAGGRHAKPSDRTHSVLPGESLWTIATDLLGSDASTASVAREVNRLWQLNRDRIGTGDPDLLMIGTRLELR
jgi:Tfp pilus assembly protein FimV